MKYLLVAILLPFAKAKLAIRWLLGYDGMPMMSRPNFRREFISVLLFSVGQGLVLPEFTQLFVLKTLEGPVWAAALLLSQLSVGTFCGTFLSHFLQRKRRVQSMIVTRVIIGVFFIFITILPPTPNSTIPFLGLLMVPALLLAVSMSIQASVRHNNYPESIRGQVLARLIIAWMGMVILSTRLASWALDTFPKGRQFDFDFLGSSFDFYVPSAHRLIYLAAATGVLASAFTYRKIRVRQEADLLRKSSKEPVHLLAGFRVLFRDRAFGLFMLWHMFSGAGVMLSRPVMALWLTQVMGVSYSQGNKAMVTTSFMFTLLAMPVAGWLFDRMSVMKYRAAGTTLWSISRWMLYTATFLKSWPLIYAAYCIEGVGRSAGAVSWNIGHTKFAKPEQSQLYIGIHMTLQGIRGLTLPFVGVWLYSSTPIGTGVLAIAGVLQTIATIGYFFTKPPAGARAIPPVPQSPRMPS